MNNKQKWFLLIVIALGSSLGVLTAQQMYSGGQAVSQSGTWTVQPGNTANTTAWKVDGSAVTQPISGSVAQSGTWTVQPGNTANTTAWKVDGSAVTQPTSLASLPALAAGTAKVGITYPYTSCGTTAFSKALQAMPTSSTAVASATTCLLTLQISNTTAGSLTVTVSDNAGTPINFLNAVTVNAGETREYSFPNGMNFASGIKVAASGAGITYAAEGLQ
jgi:hypothetical protein